MTETSDLTFLRIFIKFLFLGADGIQFALQVDTEYNIPVSPLATLEKLITLMLELSEVEIRQLSSYVLNAQSFPFGAIVPSTTTVRDQAYMIEHGWFPEPETDE
jgi:hypothetical protein